MSQAKLEIRIWTEGDKPLPDDLPDAFRPHTEHVADMVAQGYIAGEVVDEEFRGWWEIIKS